MMNHIKIKNVMKKGDLLKMEYETLEMAIIKLWKSRGIDVEVIQFHCGDKKGIWTITARLKGLEK